jgi:1,4-dihydroxy-2-naphthoate octaprenyltransferase
MSTIRAGSPRAWLLASRPATLTAAIVPVAVGTACAAALDGVAVGPAVAALIGAILLQIGANFANDAFDFESGADDAERIGPTRAAQAGLLTTTQLRAGVVTVFAAALAIGIYLTWVAGWQVVAIGIGSMLAAVAYTGGPYPLGYHGLGDVFVMAFFGFVAVCGTVFVQLGTVPALAWWAAVPVGALATAILVVNNVRDRAGDARVGKRTLAVRFGETAGRLEYLALIAGAYAVPVGLFATGKASAWVLLPLATAPIALVLTARLWSLRGAALNPCLVGTAKLLLVYGVLFAAGLVPG